MKYQRILFLLLFAGFCAKAQDEHPMESKITDVTVFLNKAQITRTAKAHLAAGQSALVLTGLSAQMDPQSIQVSGTGSFVILGVQQRTNYLSDSNVPPKLKMLKDSVTYLQKQLASEQSRKDILNKEESMILSNQKMGGTQQNVSATDLKTMADFFLSRLGEIADARQAIDERVLKINDRVTRLSNQIQEQTNTLQQSTGEIVVNVTADAAVNASLEVSYIVANAGWSPLYDLRATDTKSPLQLNYKANVYQTTGEPWDQVNLTLSTSNPDLGGLKPELYPWYLNQMQATPYGANMDMERKSAMPAAAMSAEASDMKTTADYVSVQQSTVSTQFQISLPYTIPSSGKAVVVDIQNLTVPADYSYAAAPKLDPDAFLLAKTTGWEQYNLLPGEASVFFEGTFVSKTFLNPQETGDTLAISLGRDKRIVIKRESIKDFTSRHTIGANKRETHGYEISVRNTKQEPVTITIEDQMPVSQNSQIEVTADDTGGAKYNTTTGKLSWDVTVLPNDTKKMSFRFEVKYPKDWTVSGL